MQWHVGLLYYHKCSRTLKNITSSDTPKAPATENRHLTVFWINPEFPETYQDQQASQVMNQQEHSQLHDEKKQTSPQRESNTVPLWCDRNFP